MSIINGIVALGHFFFKSWFRWEWYNPDVSHRAHNIFVTARKKNTHAREETSSNTSYVLSGESWILFGKRTLYAEVFLDLIGLFKAFNWYTAARSMIGLICLAPMWSFLHGEIFWSSPVPYWGKPCCKLRFVPCNMLHGTSCQVRVVIDTSLPHTQKTTTQFSVFGGAITIMLNTLDNLANVIVLEFWTCLVETCHNLYTY